MSGKLGSADLSAGQDTLLYTVPVGKTATVNIRLANRNGIDVLVNVAIGSGNAPAAADYIAYQNTVDGNGVYEDSGIVMSAGEKVWVRSDNASVSARVHGMED